MLRSSDLAEWLYIWMAYHYYVKDSPVVSDSYFDEVAKYLKNLNCEHLTVDDLNAGTYLGDYPDWMSTLTIKPYDKSDHDHWRDYDHYLHIQMRIEHVFLERDL